MTDTTAVTRTFLTRAIISYDQDRTSVVTLWRYERFGVRRNTDRAHAILSELDGTVGPNYIAYHAYRVAFAVDQAVLGSATTIPTCTNKHADPTVPCPKCGYYHDISFSFKLGTRTMTREQFNQRWLAGAQKLPPKEDVPKNPWDHIDWPEDDRHDGMTGV